MCSIQRSEGNARICFQICRSRCFLWHSKTSTHLNAPRPCWSLHLISWLPHNLVFLTGRRLMWRLDCIHLRLRCVLRCLSVSLGPGFDHARLWNESDMNTLRHTQPTQVLHTHTHTHTRMKLRVSHRCFHAPALCLLACVSPGGQGCIYSLLYECLLLY